MTFLLYGQLLIYLLRDSLNDEVEDELNAEKDEGEGGSFPTWQLALISGLPCREVCFYTSYVLEAVSPPRPVQLVWKNWPRGLSMRS